jgi:hypothetical protein
MHLLTFSKTQYLSSRYFYENLIERINFSTDEGRAKLEDFQRILAIKINEIKVDQRIYEQFCIVTSSKGYKIAATDEEFESGYEYGFKKIKEPIEDLKFIDKMHKKFLKLQPESNDLFLKEPTIIEQV